MQAEDDIMAHPTGIGGDALLSTLVNHVASREGVIEAAELDLIFGIVSSLAGRISPDALIMAHAKLSALVTAQEPDAVQNIIQDMAHEAPTPDVETALIDAETPAGIQVHHFNDVEQQPFISEASSDHAANEDQSGATCQIEHSEMDASSQLSEANASFQAKPETVVQDEVAIVADDEYHLSFNDILDQPHLDQAGLVSDGMMANEAVESVAIVTACADVPVAATDMLASDMSPSNMLALCATCQPAELVVLASCAAPSPQLCNLIVARGHPEALAAIARNPAARFAKSSFTTMVELAASDFSIRQALCSRADLGDMILERLWPYLSSSSRSAVMTSGCRASYVEAALLCGDAQLAVEPTDAEDTVLSVAEWTAAIEAGQETLCNAMRTLDSEGRIVDVAMVLAARSKLSPEVALALILGTYDRCAIVLARLAGCDDDSLVSLMHVRGRAGARSTADKRGPLHAFSRMSEDEAIGLARSMERQLAPRSGSPDSLQASSNLSDTSDEIISIAA